MDPMPGRAGLGRERGFGLEGKKRKWRAGLALGFEPAGLPCCWVLGFPFLSLFPLFFYFKPNSNLGEFKFKFEFKPSTQTKTTMHQHECNKKF